MGDFAAVPITASSPSMNRSSGGNPVVLRSLRLSPEVPVSWRRIHPDLSLFDLLKIHYFFSINTSVGSSG